MLKRLLEKLRRRVDARRPQTSRHQPLRRLHAKAQRRRDDAVRSGRERLTTF